MTPDGDYRYEAHKRSFGPVLTNDGGCFLQGLLWHAAPCPLHTCCSMGSGPQHHEVPIRVAGLGRSQHPFHQSQAGVSPFNSPQTTAYLNFVRNLVGSARLKAAAHMCPGIVLRGRASGKAHAKHILFCRWRLAVMDMKDSTIYLVNGIAMSVAFFLARVVVNGLGLIHLWMIR